MDIHPSEYYTSYMYSYPHKGAYAPLNDIDVPSLLKNTKSAGLYFHIPFCGAKCGYCNLFSVANSKANYFDLYIDAICSQALSLDLLGNNPETGINIDFQSLTIGGGTPLVLSAEQLERLFKIARDIMKNNFYNSPSCVETSPNDTTSEKLSILKSNNVNRISIGVQSFIKTELVTLMRAHSSVAAKQALELIKNADFNLVNIDLIYGIPGQDINSLQYSIDSALYYDPDEIFIYPLYIRNGTALSRKLNISEEQSLIRNSTTLAMYNFLQKYLTSRGYYQTSMRRFSKNTPEYSGNCGFESTAALGCGGRSYLGNTHFCSPYHIDSAKCLDTINNYINSPTAPELIGYILNEDEEKRRFVIKNLLYIFGVDINLYQQKFGLNRSFDNTIIETDFPVIKELVKDGYAVYENNFLKLTQEGLSYSDYIGTLFISDSVKSAF